VGAQWGDEGKGKWIDILSKETDAVVRYQGGNNAGHTLYINGQKTVLHQIPSGIFQPGKFCALTAGVVINPVQLVEEINKISGAAEVTPERLFLSARAHVITPWHIYLDGKRESETTTPIGTTKRGIGPTYEAKASRRGLRLCDYVDTTQRAAWIHSMCTHEPLFNSHYDKYRDEWQAFEAAAAHIQPFVGDAEEKLRKLIDQNKKLLVEGAQGALLDLNHGTYPFVTSSSTISGGAMSSIGFSPKKVESVLGVTKAYCTRVGEGPFPTELHDETGRFLAKAGNEFGATTGRPRRCGWLDAVALRYSARVNGFDGIILNKLDILTGLEQIKVATAYDHPTLGRLEDFPWDLKTLAQCSPIYETTPGWKENIAGVTQAADLPAAVHTFVALVEKSVGCKVVMIGTGVNREDAVFL
jgi:adenylosuccinate synthase